MLRNKCLYILSLIFITALLASCAVKNTIPESMAEIDGHTFTERVENKYAGQFAIDRYTDGVSVIHTAAASYLILPEAMDAPADTKGMRVIQKPLKNVYLAASADMDFFSALGCMNALRFSAVKTDDWSIDSARDAMENGDILYAGKYREPDYELLLSGGCTLSIESTMIEHTPEVKEKLEELGITVFVDYSSYETHPLGRCEWIKVYGEMLDSPGKAEELFNQQLDEIPDKTDTGKKVVYFYINSNGQAVTRKPGDYVTKMIELAGGENVFKNIGDDTKASAVTLEMEDFYAGASDADYIIYDTAIGGELTSVQSLTEKNALLADFKAVKESRVWCTGSNLFQSVMESGAIIREFNEIFTGNAEGKTLKYLYKAGGNGGE